MVYVPKLHSLIIKIIIPATIYNLESSAVPIFQGAWLLFNYLSTKGPFICTEREFDYLFFDTIQILGANLLFWKWKWQESCAFLFVVCWVGFVFVFCLGFGVRRFYFSCFDFAFSNLSIFIKFLEPILLDLFVINSKNTIPTNS